jgi:hypothetical protein
MRLSSLITLLLAAAVFAQPVRAQATTCTIDISGLSLTATRGRAAAGARKASIACKGAQLRLTVAPALQPYLESFTGALWAAKVLPEGKLPRGYKREGGARIG